MLVPKGREHHRVRCEKQQAKRGCPCFSALSFSFAYVTCQGCCFLAASWQETLWVGFLQTGVYNCRKQLCSGKQAGGRAPNIPGSDGDEWCEQGPAQVRGFWRLGAAQERLFLHQKHSLGFWGFLHPNLFQFGLFLLAK